MQVLPERVSRGLYGLITVFVLTVTALLFFEANEKVFHALDALGIAATLFGLVLVVDQLSKLRSSTEAAERASAATMGSMTFFLRATEISRLLKLIDEVKQCNRDKKIEVAILRLQDVRNDVIFIANNPTMTQILGGDSLGSYVRDLGVLIAGMEKDIQLRDDSMDYVKANNQLDKIASALTTLDSRIKQKEAPPWTPKT